MTFMRFGTIFCTSSLLLLLAMPARADRTYLQPESIQLGDIALLVIEYDNSLPSLFALDTSLLEQDFELLQKDSRIDRLDQKGSSGHRMQWRLQITPRRSGRLKIPAIRYGERWTSPRYVEVKPRPIGEQRVFVELDSATPNPYVGQQAQLSARLYYNLPVDDRIAEKPYAKGLQVRRSAPEKNYSVERAGREFEVLEQAFALFASQAGPLELSPAIYRVTIVDNENKRRIIRRSDSLTLQVKPPPASYSGNFWLPAIDLQLSQHWSHDENQLQVGDSLDWSLNIIAQGLPAESLPTDLLLQNNDKLRIYADQAVLDNRFENGQIIGHLKQRYAVIVTEPGTIELPPLKLKWWDLVNDHETEARLEGRVFNISGSDAQEGMAGQKDNPARALVSLPRIGYGAWIMLLTSLLLVTVVTLAFGRLKTRLLIRIDTMSQQRRIRQRLKRACLSNDAAAARLALIDWARQRWPEATIVGLRQICGDGVSVELRQQLGKLDTALFARKSVAWRGQALWDSLHGIFYGRRSRSHNRISRLPGLYPGQP